MNEPQKHAGGRPLIFESPEKLQEAITAYFEGTKRPTLAGLAFGLGIDRSTLYNYSEREEFFHIIKKAREQIEMAYEERLVWDNAPTGTIFALKNMGWKDKTETDLNVAGSLGLVWNEVKVYDGPEAEGSNAGE